MNWRPKWLKEERRTAMLVRACYDRVRAHGPLDAEQIHALCKLTWITKYQGEHIDHTRSVLVPALSLLLDLDLSADDNRGLLEELRDNGVAEATVKLIGEGVGIVNFYNAFRNSSLVWIRKHLDEVSDLVDGIAQTGRDEEVQKIYAAIEALPPLPRKGGGAMSCDNLLTPLMACLEPRQRAPIVNGRLELRRHLAQLGLAHETLEEQCRGLQRLIGQCGLEDAFAVDVADDETIEQAFDAAKASEARGPVRERLLVQPPQVATAPLAERNDDDIELLRSVDVVAMRQAHNTMTNALRGICRRANLQVEEGLDPSCRFDALIRHYEGDERHLLIELKTQASPPFTRMAVGQLLDYRRKLPDAAAIDLAALFPERPPKEARDFLGYVGVRTLWLSPERTRIEGDVRIGKMK